MSSKTGRLLMIALVKLLDLQPLRPFREAPGRLAGDDARPQADELGEQHAEAVLDVVRLELFSVRQDGERPVGQRSVHVRQDHLDAAGAGFGRHQNISVRHRSWRWMIPSTRPLGFTHDERSDLAPLHEVEGFGGEVLAGDRHGIRGHAVPGGLAEDRRRNLRTIRRRSPSVMIADQARLRRPGRRSCPSRLPS